MGKHTIFGIIFSVLLGTLLHFSYNFSGQNVIVGVFSATNESIWEHLKLLFYPVLVFSVVEYFAYAKNIPNFIPARTISLILGLLFIITAYYTYSGVIGKNYDFVNIIIFVLSVIIIFMTTNIIIKNNIVNASAYIIIFLVIILVLIILFTFFTFYPPRLNIFLDPSLTSFKLQ